MALRYLLADPTLTSRTPGEEFARSVVAKPADDVIVRLAVSLPTTFPLAAHRPRYTVRHLLKTATVVSEPVGFVDEALRETTVARSGVSYQSTPEAKFTPRLAEATLTDLVAQVTLPTGLVEDPALLAAFVDHRLVVRLCTVENEAFLQGSADGVITGLLRLVGVRNRRAEGDLDLDITRAAAEVEETGGSCDGIVVHPDRYWDMVRTGLLGRLSDSGVRVSRTRMISPQVALLGDFRAAVTLLEPGYSTIALRRASGAVVAEATVRVGLAAHLPQHFVLLDLR